jgi:DNA-binding transcriptional MerR regulator
MMVLNNYQIKELAKKAGVSVRTIRFYIEEGLLPAPPTRGRYSVYTDDYLERIELIRLLKERFLPLKEIRSRLNALDADEVRQALAQERAHLQAETHAVRDGTGTEGDQRSALDYVTDLLSNRPGLGRGNLAPTGQGELGSVGRVNLAPGQGNPAPTGRGDQGSVGQRNPAPTKMALPESDVTAPKFKESALQPAPPAPNAVAARAPRPAAGAANQAMQASPTGSFSQAEPAQSAEEPEEDVWERIRLAPGVELHIQKSAAQRMRHKLEQLKQFARHLFNS